MRVAQRPVVREARDDVLVRTAALVHKLEGVLSVVEGEAAPDLDAEGRWNKEGK